MSAEVHLNILSFVRCNDQVAYRTISQLQKPSPNDTYIRTKDETDLL